MRGSQPPQRVRSHHNLANRNTHLQSSSYIERAGGLASEEMSSSTSDDDPSCHLPYNITGTWSDEDDYRFAPCTPPPSAHGNKLITPEEADILARLQQDQPSSSLRIISEDIRAAADPSITTNKGRGQRYRRRRRRGHASVTSPVQSEVNLSDQGLTLCPVSKMMSSSSSRCQITGSDLLRPGSLGQVGMLNADRALGDVETPNVDPVEIPSLESQQPSVEAEPRRSSPSRPPSCERPSSTASSERSFESKTARHSAWQSSAAARSASPALKLGELEKRLKSLHVRCVGGVTMLDPDPSDGVAVKAFQLTWEQQKTWLAREYLGQLKKLGYDVTKVKLRSKIAKRK